jgi:hypothetical protein
MWEPTEGNGLFGTAYEQLQVSTNGPKPTYRTGKQYPQHHTNEFHYTQPKHETNKKGARLSSYSTPRPNPILMIPSDSVPSPETLSSTMNACVKSECKIAIQRQLISPEKTIFRFFQSASWHSCADNWGHYRESLPRPDYTQNRNFKARSQ